jgi:amino acid adenylation domain-containing protein/non-ribosomal peptide synthase protein (TIGR01720 family)
MTDLHKRLQALSPEKRAQLERLLAAKARTAPVEETIPARGSAAPRLSLAQQREWLTEQLRGSNNMRGAVRLAGRLDVGVLHRVIREIVSRHEVLRTNVVLRDGAPVAVVQPPGEPVIPLVDLSGMPEGDRAAEVDRLILEQSFRPFDVETDVLLRAMLIRLGEQEHVMLLTAHHMASDGWSQGILVTEIAALHEAFLHGDESPLAPLTIQFADYAAWQRDQLDRDGFAPHLTYWREQLRGMPPRLALPADHPPPPEPSFSGATYRYLLSPAASKGIDDLVKSAHASPFMVMLASLNSLLYRFTSQTDLVIGAPIAGRNRPELEPLFGCFVNVLLLRVQVRGTESFTELLTKVRTVTLDGYEHQDLPYEELIDELRPARRGNQTPLVQMLFNFDNVPPAPVQLTGLSMMPIPVDWDGVNVELGLMARQSADGMQLLWQYDTELFEPETMLRLSRHLERIVEQVVAAPATLIDDLTLVDQDNIGAAAVMGGLGPDGDFSQVIRRWATQTPDAPAVISNGAALSYRELDSRANRLAHLLRERGAGRGSVVGICTESSFRLAEAILGVLKAGAAFLPLDRNEPAARMSFLLADATARHVLVEGDHGDGFDAQDVEVIDVADETALHRFPDTDPEAGTRPDDLAYLVYTSGSTGQPKGVPIEHGSLLHFARCCAERLALAPQDRFLQFAALSFDVLVEELFPAWLAGASVVMMPPAARTGAITDLVRHLTAEQVTLAELPTALWHQWAAAADRPGHEPPGTLRLVVVGGERVLADRLGSWERTGVPLMHVYGLTETTVSSTMFELGPGSPEWSSANLPIGTPLGNTRLYVLDDKLRPVPAGVPGELFIGGTGVGRGYVNRPALTAERFLADPYAGPGARMYRTGDLVRMRADGVLEFLNRLDRQVKIRGYRIELAEIEAALTRLDGVREAAVTVREAGDGDRRLVAHVVPQAAAVLTVGEVRRSLERTLPAFMVPSSFRFPEALPLMHNGKIDLAALEALDGDDDAVPVMDFVPPQLPVQQRIAEVWQEIIGVDRVGLHDNFFEIGGDSILAIQIASRAEAAGIHLAPADIFQHPTIAELADVAGDGPAERVDQEPPTGPFPPVPLQRWFFGENIGDPHHWNLAVLLEVDRTVRPELLREAFGQLVTHHDGLRQRFTHTGGVLHAEVAVAEPRPAFEHVDLRDLDAGAQDDRVRTLGAAAQAGLDLAAGPLIRAMLFDLGDRPHRLLVIAHHLVIDSVSWRILLDDLRELCRAPGAALPPATTSWRTWAGHLEAYASSAELAQEVPYWSRLAAAPPVPLPVDFPAERLSNLVGARRRLTTQLGADETEALLRNVPAAYHTQVNDVLLAALARTMTAWTGSSAHVIDLEGHGRDRPVPGVSLLRTVGWLSVVHPVRLHADLTQDPGGTLKAVKELLREVPGGGAGWNLLRHSRAAEHPEIAAARPPELVFNYLGQVDGLLAADGPFTVSSEPVEPVESPRGARPYLIELSGVVIAGQLQLDWRYGGAVHRDETIEKLAATYLGELRALVEHCATLDAVEHTPSDFPAARVGQTELDALLHRLAQGH